MDTTKTWAPDQWVGGVVTLVTGANANQYRTITGNTADTLMWMKPLGAPLAVGDAYIIGKMTYDDIETRCRSCHNPLGQASSMPDVGQHVLPDGTKIGCGKCHDPHNVEPNSGAGAGLIRVTLRWPTANADVTFPSGGDNPFIAGAPSYNGVCEACHTETAFHRNDGSGDATHMADQECSDCHVHASGFAGGPSDWAPSKHNDTQEDVAGELAEERAGQTPADVVSGDDPENCVACHGPTAVEANGGMDESQALACFFTTTDGRLTEETVVAHADEWPGVACVTCHDPHAPGTPSYFNSGTGEHMAMASSAELCGQCHGNLRFPDTDHRSFGIIAGTGGVAVPDQRTMPGATCTSCHMFTSDAEGTEAAMSHGHSFSVMVTEADGSTRTGCTACHHGKDAAAARADIEGYQAELEVAAQEATLAVEAAAAALAGNPDPALAAKLERAQHNLDYSLSDESGGFHNHRYLMSLVEDANAQAGEILAAVSP